MIDKHAVTILGDNVRHYRNLLGMSQQKLGYLANIDTGSIGRIERGTVNTGISMLFELAKALEVSPAELIHERI
jgi:transcriptional regulator with XRE-family HTH domain